MAAGAGVGQTDNLHLDKSEHCHRAHLKGPNTLWEYFYSGIKCVVYLCRSKISVYLCNVDLGHAVCTVCPNVSQRKSALFLLCYLRVDNISSCHKYWSVEIVHVEIPSTNPCHNKTFSVFNVCFVITVGMAQRTNNKRTSTFSNVIFLCYTNSYVPVAFVHKLLLVGATPVFLIGIICQKWIYSASLSWLYSQAFPFFPRHKSMFHREKADGYMAFLINLCIVLAAKQSKYLMFEAT